MELLNSKTQFVGERDIRRLNDVTSYPQRIQSAPSPHYPHIQMFFWGHAEYLSNERCAGSSSRFF